MPCSRLDRDKLDCIVIVFAAFMIIALVDGTTYCAGIYVSFWMPDLNVSRAKLDGIGSLQTGISFFLGPVFSKLIRKYGYRNTASVGGLICVFSFIVCVFTVHISMLYIFYGLIPGLGLGSAYISAMVAITVNFEEKRPIAMGIISCGSGIGTASMSVIVPMILAHTKWRTSMLFLAALSAAVSLLGAMIRSREKLRRRTVDIIPPPLSHPHMYRIPSEISESGLSTSSTSTALLNMGHFHYLMGTIGSYLYMSEIDKLCSKEDRVKQKNRQWSLFRTAGFDLLLVTTTLYSLAFLAPILCLYDRLKQKKHESGAISAILSVNGIVSSAARLSVGLISVLKWCNKTVFMLVCTLICSASIICSNYLNTSWQFGIFCGVYGAACGGFAVLQPLVLAEQIPADDLTNGLGILVLFSGIGYLIGPPLIAALYSVWNSYEACYYACGIVIFCAALMIFLITAIQMNQRLSERRVQALKQRMESQLTGLNVEHSDSTEQNETLNITD
ncbi:unnamed protein product [Calicophoron daubneyi]|uniref:Major facilitator superfamily (MFS) profile domain-containing protein n=1 Tax=Calicophoron daubneyi TaxID=300641 RepID=A0AAV2TGP9_CALDB